MLLLILGTGCINPSIESEGERFLRVNSQEREACVFLKPTSSSELRNKWTDETISISGKLRLLQTINQYLSKEAKTELKSKHNIAFRDDSYYVKCLKADEEVVEERCALLSRLEAVLSSGGQLYHYARLTGETDDKGWLYEEIGYVVIRGGKIVHKEITEGQYGSPNNYTWMHSRIVSQAVSSVKSKNDKR
jgi:hypothetical protein